MNLSKNDALDALKAFDYALTGEGDGMTPSVASALMPDESKVSINAAILVLKGATGNSDLIADGDWGDVAKATYAELCAVAGVEDKDPED